MKISHLIEELQRILADYGDLPVNYGKGCWIDVQRDNLEVKGDEDE